ncbi:MAG: hypothetical protein P1V20_13240 [Verrucomicrobiales bacterium]|nr:hypothetical protein [Verrucomicrobiales bacterium]
MKSALLLRAFLCLYSGFAILLTLSSGFAQTQNVTLVDTGQTLGLIPNATNDPGIPPTIVQAGESLVPYHVISSPQSIVSLDGTPNLSGVRPDHPPTEQIAIDAYLLRLLLATTDITAGTPEQDFSLPLVRRYHSTVYHSKSGLRPGEDPTQVFGPGWASSVLPNIHLESPNAGLPPLSPPENPPSNDTESIVYQEWLLDSIRHQILHDQWLDRQNHPHKATVTDEFGVRYTFILDRAMQWVPVSCDDPNTLVQGLQLTLYGSGVYRLTKPSGVTVDYHMVAHTVFVPHNRWDSDIVTGQQPDSPAVAGVHHRWAKATAVSKETQSFAYSYADPTSFIPISIANSTNGATLTVTPSTQNPALIGQISDEDGNTVDYTYTQNTHAARHSSDISLWELTNVTGTDIATGNAETTSYDFVLDTEQSQEPPPPPKDPALWGEQENWVNLTDPDLSPVEFYHWNLKEHTEGTDTITFNYLFNQSQTSYFDSPWWKGEYILTGLPMLLSEVIQDTGTTTLELDSHESLSNSSNDLGLETGGWKEVAITGSSGQTRTYTYDDLEYQRLDTSRNRENVSVYSTPLVGSYGRLSISEAGSDTPLLTVVPNNQSNLGQIEHHLSATDSDRDGFSDGWENVIGSNRNDDNDNPTVSDSYFVDSDNDGISNGLEIAYYGTDPYNTSDFPGSTTTTTPGSMEDPDSDGDGMSDAWEIRHGLNPADSSDATRDDDYDRLNNLTEFQTGTIPTVDWNFLAVSESASLESLNERGQLLRTVHSETTGEYLLEVWERGQWSTRGSLGDDSKETNDQLVRHNNHGLAAAVFYQIDPNTGSKINPELRILHPDDTLTFHVLNASHSPVLHKVTDSGFVYVKATALDETPQTVVWTPSTQALITHDNFELLDGNEPGHLIATGEIEQTVDGVTTTVAEGYFWNGTEWTSVDGQVVALNNHGQALIAHETTSTGPETSLEIRLWNDGNSVATGLSLEPGQQAQLNDRDQFVLHGSGGEAPVFVLADGAQTTISVPSNSNFTDPWILVTGLNDTGEVAGSFYDPEATDPNAATFQAYSWHMGNYLFTGIYDDSSVHGITNSGFLSLGANEKVTEEQDFDGDGIPDQTNETLKTRLGILAPANDADQNGLPDDWEAFHGVIDPEADPDNDNLPNWAEYIHFTDPNRPDSDFDSYSDHIEITQGADPARATDGDLTGDVDQDGLTLSTELELGTNPGLADTDNDGLDDHYEVANQLNPLDSDSDNDGFSDGTEVAEGTDPLKNELGNHCNGAEHLMAAFMHVDDRPEYISPLSEIEDADRDGMLDSWETVHGLDPENPEDAWRDFDYDRIINRTEYLNGTVPVAGWTFEPIAGELSFDNFTRVNGHYLPHGAKTLRGDGTILSVKAGPTVFEVTRWENGQWVPDGDLGSISNTGGDVGQVLATERGMIVAVVGKSGEAGNQYLVEAEIRVRDADGNVSTIGGNPEWPEVSSNWKSVSRLWVTESGWVAGVAKSEINNGNRSIPFRWRNGNLEILGESQTFSNGDTSFSPFAANPVGISEVGGYADEGAGVLLSSEWNESDGLVKAVGPYGKLWTESFPASQNVTSVDVSTYFKNRMGDRLKIDVDVNGYSDVKAAVIGIGTQAPLTVTHLGAFDNNYNFSPYQGQNLIPVEGIGNFDIYEDTFDESGNIVSEELIESIDFDLDDDGWTNEVEELAGTDPVDGGSFPGMTPSLDTTKLYVYAMNDVGDVVGLISTDYENNMDSYSYERQGFLWRSRSFVDIDGLGGENAFYGINNSGYILASKTVYVDEVIYEDVDGDGIEDEVATGNKVGQLTWGILSPNNDSDGNGLPDDWESLYGVSDGGEDPDNDGIPNQLEYVYGTHPNCRDTDSDQIDDFYEILIGNNPLYPDDPDLDNDNDSISNFTEFQQGTDGLSFSSNSGILVETSAPPVVDNEDSPPGDSSQIVIVSGDFQQPSQGQLPQPIVVRLLDENGDPVPSAELQIASDDDYTGVAPVGYETFFKSIILTTDQSGLVSFTVKDWAN